MDIAISGASGLIGSALRSALQANGDRVVALVRRATTSNDEIQWNPADGSIDAASLEGIDAVVHLAGAGIGDRRWSEDRKRLIYDSRIDGTGLIADALASLNQPPTRFICGSAVGFYGSRGDEELTEVSDRGQGFLADLVVDWEQAAQPAVDAGIHTTFARTGIVLSPKGGSLKPQLLLFKLGLGGRFGPGTQWLPWISLNDQVRALQHLLTSDLAGPVNLSAPEPVRNTEFTKTLGNVLSRPTLIPVPLIGPKLLFGSEFVEEAILASQRVLPAALQADGFHHDDPTLDGALRAMLGKNS